jgi:hypothetical protein
MAKIQTSFSNFATTGNPAQIKEAFQLPNPFAKTGVL